MIGELSIIFQNSINAIDLIKMFRQIETLMRNSANARVIVKWESKQKT